METKKVKMVNCKLCSLQFKNYYQLKKHKSNCNPSLPKEKDNYIHKNSDKCNIYLTKLDYTNIDNIDSSKLEKHEKHISMILFNYIYKKHLEQKLLDGLSSDDMKKKIFNVTKNNLLKMLYESSIKMSEDELYKNLNMNIYVNIKKLNINFTKNDFYFYQDPIVFPIIFYKSINEYYEKLTNLEKKIINKIFELKKTFYENDELVNTISENPIIMDLNFRCLYINDILDNKPEEEINKLFITDKYLQTTFVELSILYKFQSDFADYCSKQSDEN